MFFLIFKRAFSTEFNVDAANLVLRQGYTYKEAQEVIGARYGVLSAWLV